MEVTELEGDPFEKFFNNESLSDRTLCIVEVEEILNLSPSAADQPKLKQKRKLPSDFKDAIGMVTDLKSCKQEQEPDAGCSSSSTYAPIHNENVEQDEAPAINNTNVEEEETHADEERREGDMNSVAISIIDIDGYELETVNIEGDTCLDEDLVNLENDEVVENNVQDIKTEVEDAKDIARNDQEVDRDDLFQVIHSQPHDKSSQQPSTPTSNDTHQNEHRSASSGQVEVTECIESNLNSDAIEKRILKSTKVFVHSVILAAKSSFFKCLFSCGMKETNEKEIKIEVGKGETDDMLILLRCFYNKQHIENHLLNTVLGVCFLAMRYCYDGLINTCLDYLSICAKTLRTISEINKIVLLISTIEGQLPLHKEKCAKVKKTCGPTLINIFYPLDECLEKTPGKFFQLPLHTLNLFLEPDVQQHVNMKYGNLFMYSMQAWLRSRFSRLFEDAKFKSDVLVFIEKLLTNVEIKNLTGDFLTNVMTYENSPFSIWNGYKDWYINKLQECVYSYGVQNSLAVKTFAITRRKRPAKFVRQENGADIFSVIYPIILNGFEIGIYLRGRHDGKIHILCKCKNMLVNKHGFGKSSLAFKLNGNIKMNDRKNTWSENFPTLQDWFNFTYNKNTMFTEMYSLCKLRPETYKLAKACGFILWFQMQQIK